jgi:hypothetical protein
MVKNCENRPFNYNAVSATRDDGILQINDKWWGAKLKAENLNPFDPYEAIQFADEHIVQRDSANWFAAWSCRDAAAKAAAGY